MAAATLPIGRPRGVSTATLLLLAAALGTAVLALLPAGTLPTWVHEVPRAWRLGWDKPISAFTQWLVETAALGPIAFRDVTRGVAWVLQWPLDLATAVLASGLQRGQGSAAVLLLPPLPWLAVVVLAGLIGWRRGGAGLAALAAGAFLYLAVFGQWQSAMVTLASIAVAVPLGAAGGLVLGIAAFRRRWVERALEPVLDLMQTVPVFAYLVPILVLFGFGPVAAMLATIIYAMPPMVRVTVQALRAVSEEIVEYGRMAGCTRRQMLWKVQVPAARPALLVGLNQVIMLSLNMVIIASMIGAGGLGFDVLAALRRLDIGAGLEAGLAIVLLAVALDRLSQARPAIRHEESGRFWRRALLAIALIYAASWFVPAIARWPEPWRLSTGGFFAGIVGWLNVHLFDTFEAVKAALVLNLLVPVKRFLLAIPWPWVVLLLGVVGWRLGGPRLAALVVALALFVAFSGQWENAMETVYLCGVSVATAMAIGVPLGIWGGLSPRAWGVIRAVIDTLQTLPSFVYLIPVVMLFRVGDFTAMIAIVLYALAPAVRWTAHGIQSVPAPLVEAGIAAGCTRAQLLRRIRLPLAAPAVILGLNQTIMLGLSMLVITALVGTRDLGQEVYVALTKADVGRGIVAGLCVAAIAIIADRLLQRVAARLRARTGAA
jgi:glycine betaine/proline transport system permease protein